MGLDIAGELCENSLLLKKEEDIMHPFVRIAAGALIGGTFGFLFYRFVGCKTGACPLSANPWVATIIWAIFGALAAGGMKNQAG